MKNMPLSNKDYYNIVIEKYKKNSNRLIRTTTNTTKELEKMEKLQLEILNDTSDFSDVIEMIQNRPQFKEINIEGVKLPELALDDLTIKSKNAGKLLAKYSTPEIGVSGLLVTPEIKNNGFFGHELPFLENSVLGNEVELAINKLSGVALFQAIGSKESDRIYEMSKEVDKIEEKINQVIPNLDRIKNAANNFCNSLMSVREVYLKEFCIVKGVVEKYCDYSEFLKTEKMALNNVTLLIGILYQMCKVKLLKTDNMDVEYIELNEEVQKKEEESKIVLNQITVNNMSVGIILEEDAFEEVDTDKRGYEIISPVCADSVNVNVCYCELNNVIVYFDERKEKLIEVDKTTGESVELDLGVDLSKSVVTDFCGIEDYLFFGINGDAEDELYQYTVSDNTISCLYSIKRKTDKEKFYIQCNERYITFVHRKGSYLNDGEELIVYDYNNLDLYCTIDSGISGYILYEDTVLYKDNGTLYRFDLLSKKKKKICDLDYNMFNFVDRLGCSGIGGVVENNKLIIWTASQYSDESIEVLSIDIESGKKQKCNVSDSCELMGIYYDGYIYYFRCSSRDSLCRYSLDAKKVEVLVEQTDCASSSVSGFIKKVTSYYISRQDVSFQIINNNLYYRVGNYYMDNSTIMKVELNNGFLLSEL